MLSWWVLLVQFRRATFQAENSTAFVSAFLQRYKNSYIRHRLGNMCCLKNFGKEKTCLRPFTILFPNFCCFFSLTCRSKFLSGNQEYLHELSLIDIVVRFSKKVRSVTRFNETMRLSLLECKPFWGWNGLSICSFVVLQLVKNKKKNNWEV